MIDFLEVFLGAIVALVLSVFLRAIIGGWAAKQRDPVEIVYEAENLVGLFDLRKIELGSAHVSVSPAVNIRIALSDVNGGWLSRRIKKGYSKGNTAGTVTMLVALLLATYFAILAVGNLGNLSGLHKFLALVVLIVAVLIPIFLLLDFYMSFPFLDRMIRVQKNKVWITNSIGLDIQEHDTLNVSVKRALATHGGFFKGSSIVISNGRDELTLFKRSILISYAYTDQFMLELSDATQKALELSLKIVRGEEHSQV